MINNVVIKVNNRIHGKKVIEWWKSRGVDVGHNKGNSEGMYYGVVDGEFGVYEGFDIRTNKDVRVIKLPYISTDNQETPKFFAISPEDWREYQELKSVRDSTITTEYYLNRMGSWSTCKKEPLTKNDYKFIRFIEKNNLEYHVIVHREMIYLAK